MFVEETTSQKINVSSKNGDEKMWSHIHKSQVEKKYGGNGEDQTVFWPPAQVSQDYLLETDQASEVLISKEEYAQRKSAGQLALYKTKNF